jgi:RsiW-degrading membrane proteinase PrsW (M82 family)
MALAGGVMGIFGALVTEIRTGGIFIFFVGAPIIEEAMKPLGIYILLAKWPYVLRGRLYTAFLTALSGLSFGIIEALVYVYIYVPDAPDWFVTYRFTAPIMLHVTASFIFGLGIDRRLLDWAVGRGGFPRLTLRLYGVAVLLHAVFNVTAGALVVTGVLDFN